MSFAAGAATFNSCNKPGSIVQFTDHLRVHPNDYNALMWRAEAYSIVGQPQNSLRDIERAISVSSGIRREVAVANKISMTANIEEFGEHAKKITRAYPLEWTAWRTLARYNSAKGMTEEESQCNIKGLDLAKRFNETRDPEICWVNYDVGNHYMTKNDIPTAKTYFEAAIDSSPTHTVSHIHLCLCNLRLGNMQSARQCFEKATSLNPTLASKNFKTDNFTTFASNLVEQQRQDVPLTTRSANGASGSSHAVPRAGGVGVPSSETRTMVGVASDVIQAGNRAGGRASNVRQAGTRPSSASAAGARGGSKGGSGGRGGGGGGNGSGSDDDNSEDVSKIWKRIQKEAPSIKMFNKHKYAQSKCGKYWYSRDTAGHAGAMFKRYEDTRSNLRFKDSLDANFRPMEAKHESRENTLIRKSDMIGVK